MPLKMQEGDMEHRRAHKKKYINIWEWKGCVIVYLTKYLHNLIEIKFGIQNIEIAQKCSGSEHEWCWLIQPE